ncbi:MAG TPA: hypothetical protein VHR66_16155 [Gemmataceae bacterium]|nr:hypothetical protein [Gemmataceae bacterium]
MSVRKWLTTALVAAGLALGSSVSANAADKAEYTFGSLRALTPEAGKAQAEAWLKKVGKFDQAAFDKIWSEAEVSVLDRTIATLELGNADAKAAMTAARNAAVEAPKAVPAIVKDEKADPYLRANLALGFARGLTNGRVYEESLDALAGIKAEQTVDPAAYFFHRAVAEHSLMKKDDAMRTIVRLLDDVADAPDRYTMLGRIMFVEMATWTKDEKALSNIRRLMDNSERRLGQSRGGKTTQDIQKKIVFRLDELIKEKENQCKGQCNGGCCPGGGQGNQIGKGTIRSSSPAPDSAIMGGNGNGTVDEKKLATIAKSWGTMPEKERAKAIMDITKDLPARYRVVIEDYFKALSSASAKQP